MKKPAVRVTDHAICQYLARSGLLDIEALRRELGRRVDPLVAMGATAATIDGLFYLIGAGHHDGKPTLITVLKPGEAVPYVRDPWRRPEAAE